MEYRQLGHTGLQLSVLGYGSWITFKGQVDDKAAGDMMQIAYDNGVNFFDNAEVYARGESERIMGRVLRLKGWERSSYVLTSKAYFGWHHPNLPTQHGLARKHLREACDEALERLQTSYLDIFYCHRPDPTVPVEEIVWTMHQLFLAGKILYWGTSEWTASGIQAAITAAERYHLLRPVVEQPEYNLFRRFKVEEDYALLYDTYGLGLTTWSPLHSGMLTGKYNDGIPKGSRLDLPEFKGMMGMAYSEEKVGKARAFKAIADQAGYSMTDLALAWVIHNPHVTCAILGASKPEQLEQNLRALTIDLSPDLVEQIEKATRISDDK
ncbi:aldo/keto reductase [Dinghuibacter silviterrae]|uniref:Voltage-dependent potassium channel beta subunit n=1 Tax=Dinghuibacter silviterrae TaxID=1539049 RepID=A0A4R8DIK8_9BACT|nr:aldo/keto reductase [Dinghuibacter silviterrae]TDW97589.1 voltage-dependent potassium channel beta subunit [Dinghuibacter silviterrae]